MASNSLPSLTQRAVSGTAWSTLSTAGKQALSIASVATVARLLGPSAYGVMGMANLLIIFILNFRDLGTGTAIVQRLSVSDRLLSSLFWVNFLLGMVMAGGVAAASPLAARFFNTPELVPILCTLSVSFWLTSCGVVHASLLLRGMHFKAYAVVDLTSALASYLVALSCAYSGLGVWSLVFANVTNSFTSTLGYWLASVWRPGWVFDRAEVKSITNFSLNLSGFGIVNYFARNADNIVVGRVLGRAPLGDYQTAYNLMLTPIQNISSVIGQVTLPAFAKIQEDNARFRFAYLKSCMLVALITFPVMAGLGVVAHPLIIAVLGEKWVGAIRVFQILAPVGLVQSVQTSVGQIYVAKGRTDWNFRFGAVYCVVLVAAFLAGVHFGTVGVAAAYSITYLGLLMIPGFAIPFRLIGLKLSTFFRAMLPQLLLTGAMTLLCWIWLRILETMSVTNPWVQLLSTSFLGAAAYSSSFVLLWPAVMGHLEDALGTSHKGARLAGYLLQARQLCMRGIRRLSFSGS
jgi:PST family polysaccharide transporter